MNIRDKAFELKVHTQVAASRAPKPVTRSLREQRDAHQRAVDEKINDLVDQDVDEWRQEQEKAQYRIDRLQEMLGMN